ncbi:unnamed protein product [Cladocopium goreaui]|uniref:CCHC-type domain-containing protein n=1 Tax=Cladocopium goreaui TaxID=2562237 RepID=A0A9P1G4I6_9DINO|nr:unnamed protein product [Cladocopium goreaui]
MDPAKLKSKDCVRHLVEALGGSWGRLASEERYDMFEKALYQTVQKSDESNDSNLARHDAAFDDLLAAKVTIEEEDMEEEIFLQSLLEAGDEDAVIINDFEEAILTACQESAELAPCFASYQEARQCLRDKAKSRGFWPLGSGKGRTKGKKGKFGAPNKGSMSTNQQANFHRPSISSLGAKKNYENESFTGILHEEEHGTSTEFGDDLKWGVDVVEELPEEAVAYEEDGNPKDQILNRPQGDWINGGDQIGNFDGVVYDCLVSVSALTRSLTSCITTRPAPDLLQRPLHHPILQGRKHLRQMPRWLPHLDLKCSAEGTQGDHRCRGVLSGF